MKILEEYRDIVYSTNTKTSILETTGDSWERDINRYYKPALLLIELREKFGVERTYDFLRSLDRQFLEKKEATTKIFLAALEQNQGTEAAEFFTEALNRKTWIRDSSGIVKSEVKADPVYLGKWSGMLTQFGSAARFVVNIKETEGITALTLDSPDQNVFDIPVSDLSIIADQIYFKVGVASASFRGTLERSDQVINGTWIQRGVGYPIKLVKN